MLSIDTRPSFGFGKIKFDEIKYNDDFPEIIPKSKSIGIFIISLKILLKILDIYLKNTDTVNGLGVHASGKDTFINAL